MATSNPAGRRPWRFGGEAEPEVEIAGVELAARARYDAAAGVTLGQKMVKASEGG